MVTSSQRRVSGMVLESARNGSGVDSEHYRAIDRANPSKSGGLWMELGASPRS